MSGVRDSFAEELKAGIEGILEDTKVYKKEVLPRWARLSFNLKVDDSSNCHSLYLEPAPKYSRGCNSDSYQLGTLTFSQNGGEVSLPNGLSCPKSEVHKLGRRLIEIIEKLETPPVDNRAKWESEVAYDVPVAIFGMNYFSNLTTKGVPFAPKELLIYRSEDPASADLLRKLIGF